MPVTKTPPAVSVATLTHATPVGRLTLAATADALLYCAYDALDAAAARIARILPAADPVAQTNPSPGQQAVLDSARSQLDAYLAGRRRAFQLPFDLRLASAFTRLTVTALDTAVPYGTTSTYGELARAIGRPRAARAVGSALGANPLCVILPCHRIVGASSRAGGYAGGPDAKAFLLGLERAG
ncbi:methylated-DNA--[protein]-cysteine S-methyltransferase [Streptomyces sp. RB6PN25]|uniref:Methylated-DNA--[protein]-cysteine S-methyltransferase n=1 Tax=Streptomyces humicola TaxID=2953240 RepID=A0ABT1Q5I1_9ACTN|nr:methylated-DNA--[protein]-cysteine S-methyltransferase [Streptomyces humicola]MCQ4085186.1 methylated-DNA--[protein]-cysteine S-methyltransferase [Streptomyces humicola]